VRSRGITLTLASAVLWVATGCGGTGDRHPAPTSPEPIADAPAQESREEPPPTESGPQPAPPARAPRPAPPAPPPSESTECDAGAARWALGEQADEDLLDRARRAAGARSARFLRPGEAVTMEFLGSRLNLELDGRDKVVSVRCG